MGGRSLRKEGVQRLKRSLMQHDLWAVADRLHMVAEKNGNPIYSKNLKKLQQLIRPLIKQLAPTDSQISRLRDNYADAIASGEFQRTFAPDRSYAAYLPDRLFDPAGTWILVSGSLPGPSAPDISPHLHFVKKTPGGLSFILFPNP
ncbi:MAG: hypothetical protein ACI8UO_006632 [Verrucomicrobiales bacterium]|jgi:hypothetical protein